MDINETPYGVCYPSGEKNLFLPRLFDGMLYELDMQDPQINDCWTCLKLRLSFRVPVSKKSLQGILQNTEQSDWQTDNIGRPIFEISCSMWKSARYYGSVGWRWMLQWYRRTLVYCPGSEMSVNSRVLEVA